MAPTVEAERANRRAQVVEVRVPKELHLPLIPLLLGTWFAAVAGDQVGYLFGQRVGPSLFRRPNSRFFKMISFMTGKRRRS